jgi:hypothetical protein
LSGGEIDRLRAEPACHLQLARIEVDSEHSAPMRAQELRGHDANQPHAGHHDRLAERRLHEPNALQGDRAQHRKRCLFVGDSFGDLCAEIDRHTDDLRVLAVARDAIADRESSHASPDGDHLADIAVSERERLVELVEDGLDRRHDAVGLHLVEHHPHLVGLLARLLDPPSLPKLDHHALSANRDERARCANQQVAASCPWTWNICDFCRASSERLKNLLHAGFLGPVISHTAASGSASRIDAIVRVRP